jgi:hypothetical protein
VRKRRERGGIDWLKKGVVFGLKGLVFANKRGFSRNNRGGSQIVDEPDSRIDMKADR